ncbi:MAG TPA: molecular chaperone TorD family protein, partial [Candidatus Sulfotelmatobacter sp.]|nr:molecular chaperone TorD family protein [Candidatus Sulfotelmatobacter sp.]
AEAVQQEYWHLFGDLGPAAAPPWESVYLDREHVVFGVGTLEVRALYARFGLGFPESSRRPDDHIGLQLEFLARLSAWTAERLDAGDEAGAADLLDGQRTCLDEHLLRWVDEYVARVEAVSVTGFYAGLARLTLGLLRQDRLV